MSKEKQKKNKVTIFLLRDGISIEDFINGTPTCKKISENKKFFYTTKLPTPAKWLDFFKDKLSDLKDLFKIILPQGLLIITGVDCGDAKKSFAITFGSGIHLLNQDAYVERFGLKVLLNIIDEFGLRKISQKSMRGIPSDSVKQLSKISSIRDFDLDITQDFVINLTASPEEEDLPLFGKNVTGGNSLSVSILNDIDDVEDFLKKCYKKYTDTRYKKNYAWIDNVRPETNTNKTKRLKEILIKKIRTNDVDRIWMSIPEMINWEEVSGFTFHKRGKLRYDIELKDFLDEVVKDISKFDEKYLKRDVFVLDSNGYQKFTWKIYRCLYAEVEYDRTTYILNSGKWFEVNDDYLIELNKKYNEIIQKSKKYDLTLPNSKSGEHEGAYNKRVGEEFKEYYLTLDRKLVSLAGNSGVEVCDIYSKNKDFIHVKKYGASSVFSHLFMQGKNSAALFLRSQEYRNEIRKILSEGFEVSSEPPNPNDYKIIYAVITKYANTEKDNIPFFSKITLCDTKKYLNDLGFSNVYMKSIPIDKATTSENSDKS